MYHCHTRFYLMGRQRQLFEKVKKLPLLEGFTYEFLESDRPEEELATRADVIFADLRGTNAAATAELLARWRGAGAQLILLGDRDQAAALPEELSAILARVTDIWGLPMSDTEWGFRLGRWLQGWKAAKDAWQTSQYLEAAINGSPNLIWFKTKDGIHEKVNDSFCQTVGKTKAQVQGQGHAYIWDVEQDDPACIESERIVMERRETCISEEHIQTGNEEKTLTTYKSPL